eukprot:5724576-Pyramimonas_sp.AAC.1
MPVRGVTINNTGGYDNTVRLRCLFYSLRLDNRIIQHTTHPRRLGGGAPPGGGAVLGVLVVLPVVSGVVRQRLPRLGQRGRGRHLAGGPLQRAQRGRDHP